jgi:hypothetical protein
MATFEPENLIILDSYENGAYSIQQDLSAIWKRAQSHGRNSFGWCDAGRIDEVLRASVPR